MTRDDLIQKLTDHLRDPRVIWPLEDVERVVAFLQVGGTNARIVSTYLGSTPEAPTEARRLMLAVGLNGLLGLVAQPAPEVAADQLKPLQDS